MSRHLNFVAGCLALSTALLTLSVHSTREPQDSEYGPAIGAFGRSALDGPGADAPPREPRPLPWDQETGEKPKRRRSLDDLDLRQGATPMQAPIRRHSMPLHMPPLTPEQQKQFPKRRRGRFQRARQALRRALRRAKMRVAKAWKAVKERARRVKAGLRKGAAKIYARMRRAPWRRGRSGRGAPKQGEQRPPEEAPVGPQGQLGGQQPGEEGTGEGALPVSPVPPPKPPRTFAYRGPLKQSVEAAQAGGDEEEMAPPFPPVEQSQEGGMGEDQGKGFDMPGAGPAQPTPPESKEEGPGEEEEGDVFVDARETFEPSSDEEPFESPPSSPTQGRRTSSPREREEPVAGPSIGEEPSTAASSGGEEEVILAGAVGGEEEAPAGAVGGGEEEEEFVKQFEKLTLPTPKGAEEGTGVCGMWSSRISPSIQPAAEMCPDLCALWSLFSQPGRVSRSSSELPSLAAQLASMVSVARDLAEMGQENIPGTEKLIMTMRIAEAEDKVVRTAEETEKACWFTSVQGVLEHANREEMQMLRQTMTSMKAFFQNINPIAQKLERLMILARESQPSCLEAIEKELQARKELQAIFQAEENKARKLAEEEDDPEGLSASQTLKLAEDLRLLRLREFCSMEMLHRIMIQSRSVVQLVNDYTSRTRDWWKPEWLAKAARLRFPSPGARGVPTEIAQGCRNFERDPQLGSIEAFHPLLFYLWEVGDYRS
ncbi:hypothetical protein ACSSS7_001739 [Eimeria intestinalis]